MNNWIVGGSFASTDGTDGGEERVELELATMLLATRMELDKERGGIPGKMVVKMRGYRERS